MQLEERVNGLDKRINEIQKESNEIAIAVNVAIVEMKSASNNMQEKIERILSAVEKFQDVQNDFNITKSIVFSLSERLERHDKLISEFLIKHRSFDSVRDLAFKWVPSIIGIFVAATWIIDMAYKSKIGN